MNTIIDVEPAEINGRGSPVGGIIPETTQRLIITWMEITLATPKTKSEPNRSRAFFAIETNKRTRVAKVKTTIVAPKNPSSSPMIENTKSLSENGRNKYFCRELNSPTPNIPPLPREYND